MMMMIIMIMKTVIIILMIITVKITITIIHYNISYKVIPSTAFQSRRHHAQDTEVAADEAASAFGSRPCAADLRTNVLDFRGFDSSIILVLRGGSPRPIWNFLESLSQAILVGIMLVRRLAVQASCCPSYCAEVCATQLCAGEEHTGALAADSHTMIWRTKILRCCILWLPLICQRIIPMLAMC